jgi:hypothetical protein
MYVCERGGNSQLNSYSISTQALQKGNNGARIYASNAIRKKNKSLNLLCLASRIDAVADRIETALYDATSDEKDDEHRRRHGQNDGNHEPRGRASALPSLLPNPTPIIQSFRRSPSVNLGNNDFATMSPDPATIVATECPTETPIISAMANLGV